MIRQWLTCFFLIFSLMAQRALANETLLNPAQIDDFEKSIKTFDENSGLALDILSRVIGDVHSTREIREDELEDFYLRERAAHIMNEAFTQGHSFPNQKVEHAEALFWYSIASPLADLHYSAESVHDIRRNTTLFLRNKLTADEILAIAQEKDWRRGAFYIFALLEQPWQLTWNNQFRLKTLIFKHIRQIEADFAFANKFSKDPLAVASIDANNMVEFYVDFLVTASAGGILPKHLFIELREIAADSNIIRSALFNAAMTRIVWPIRNANLPRFRRLPLFKKINIHTRQWAIDRKSSNLADRISEFLSPAYSSNSWRKEATYLLENSGLLESVRGLLPYKNSSLTNTVMTSLGPKSQEMRTLGIWAEEVLTILGYMDGGSPGGGKSVREKCLDLLHPRQHHTPQRIPIPVRENK